MAVGIVQTRMSSGPLVCSCGKVHHNIDANRFDRLVLALKEALGPSSGLTSDDVDVEHLTRLMREYDSKEREWSGYAFGDVSRGYTRNLVDEGNGKSNLVRPRPRHSKVVDLASPDHKDSSSSSGLLERAAQFTTTAMPTA